MRRRKILCMMLAVIFCFIFTLLFADEVRYDLNKSATIKDILKENVGKRVSMKLEAGEELEGTVTKVGDQLVHISKLSRRDYFDAFVRIDKISSVIIMMRGRN